jgi:hypothetical protein
MTDISTTIQREIEDDESLEVKSVTVEITHKGLFPRRHFVHVGGSVKSEYQKERIETIARHHAGDSFRVINDVAVETPE